MALAPKIYRVHLDVSDIDRGHYEKLNLTVARHPSETMERLVLRLFARAIWSTPALEFSRGVCAGHEPALWAKAPDGHPTLWVEVGLPEADRLIKAAHHCDQVALLASGPEIKWDLWHEKEWPRISHVENIAAFGLDWSFIQAVANDLPRGIHWQLTRTEGVLYLSAGEETFEAPLRAPGS